MRTGFLSFALAFALVGLLGGGGGIAPAAHAADAKVIKISHQFPASQGDEGDFRDRLVRKFAADVEKRTNGQVKFEIYPASSLIKATSQISALRKGALDMGLVPLAYGGGEIPERQHRPDADAGRRLRSGHGLEGRADRQGTREGSRRQGHQVLVTWIWQGGGIASLSKAILGPGRCQGNEGTRRQQRDGPDAESGRRGDHQHAVERGVCRDAVRRARCGRHLEHVSYQLSAAGVLQEPDDGAGQDVLVHARAASDLEGRSTTR